MIPKVWTNMGADVKRIQSQLAAMMVKPEYQDMLTRREADCLSQALCCIETFKIRAETRMATKTDNSKVSDKEFLGVFYGD